MPCSFHDSLKAQITMSKRTAKILAGMCCVAACILAYRQFGGDASDRAMSSNVRQSESDGVLGWTLCEDYSEWNDRVEASHLARHSYHESYVPNNKRQPLIEWWQSRGYDSLNSRLHDELLRVSKEHFAETPVPSQLQDDRGYVPFTPFTYQNTDWYGASFECCIVVIGEYVSLDLLRKFQSLLRNEYRGWCIQVAVSGTPDFGADHEVAVFSDQILIVAESAESLRLMPKVAE